MDQRLKAATAALAFGLSFGTLSSGAAAQSGPTPITLSPTIAASPKLTLTSLEVAGSRAKAHVVCEFAACVVVTRLTTLEHLRSGRATLLSASGRGRNTRTVVVGSAPRVRILPGQSATITVGLNDTGLRLVDAFQRLPASATFTLTNHTPAGTLHRVVGFRR